MGQRLQIDWAESVEELRQRYKQESHVGRRTRLLALWQWRQGKRIPAVVAMLAVGYRRVQEWIAWYRQGGLEEVEGRVKGHGSRGAASYLTPIQQRAWVAKVELGELRTVWDAVAWVEARWGAHYTYKGLHDLLARYDCRPKVPRPQSAKADQQRQEAWKKGG
jgi:transposase